LALSGSVSTAEAERIRGQIIEFLEETDALRTDEITDETQIRISQLLEERFILPQKANMQSMRLRQNTN
jgi:hypothetical protein